MLNIGSGNRNTVSGGNKPPYQHRQFWILILVIVGSSIGPAVCLL